MSKFLIHYSDEALQDLEKLDGSVMKIIRRTIKEKLKTRPDIFGKPLKYSLYGTRSLRAGNWRVEYVIQGEDVLVTTIFHRSKGYS